MQAIVGPEPDNHDAHAPASNAARMARFVSGTIASRTS